MYILPMLGVSLDFLLLTASCPQEYPALPVYRVSQKYPDGHMFGL